MEYEYSPPKYKYSPKRKSPIRVSPIKISPIRVSPERISQISPKKEYVTPPHLIGRSKIKHEKTPSYYRNLKSPYIYVVESGKIEISNVDQEISEDDLLELLESYGVVDDFELEERDLYWIIQYKNMKDASMNFFKAGNEYIVERVPKKNEFIIYDDNITEEEIVDKFDPYDYEKHVENIIFVVTFRDKHDAQNVIDILNETRLGKYTISIRKI